MPSACQTCPRSFYCKEAGLQAPSGPCPAGERQQRSSGAGKGDKVWGGERPKGSCLGPGLHSTALKVLVARDPVMSKCLRERIVFLSVPPSWPGYYCDSSAGPIKDFSLYPCPQGYYCPLGTAMATHHRCPVGTYGPRRGLRSITECQLCPAGKFCALAGLAAPTGMSWRAEKDFGIGWA